MKKTLFLPRAHSSWGEVIFSDFYNILISLPFDVGEREVFYPGRKIRGANGGRPPGRNASSESIGPRGLQGFFCGRGDRPHRCHDSVSKLSHGSVTRFAWIAANHSMVPLYSASRRTILLFILLSINTQTVLPFPYRVVLSKMLLKC